MAANVLNEIEYDVQNILGVGTYGHVFRGKYKGSPAAIKVVLYERHFNKRTEHVMKKLDHENVVKLIHAENRGEFRCFALELCDASLDRLYLEEGNPEKYRGPMPSNEDAMLQLAIGLEYIHSQRVAHRDVKPANVLIQRRQSVVLLKWAGFGLSKPTTERGTYSLSGARGTINWMAPEVLELMENNDETSESNPRGTVKSDVFASGCLFFWLLTEGLHPFGFRFIIPANILENNAVNMSRLENEDYASIIRLMIEHDPHLRIESKGVTEMLKRRFPVEWNQRRREEHPVQFNDSNPLGEGYFGTVYLGWWNSTAVAVKMVPERRTNLREEAAMRTLQHQNIVQLYHVEDRPGSRLYVLELCEASLHQLHLPANHPKKYRGPMPSELQVLRQLAEGLCFIHSRAHVHRDVKPDNVLIHHSRDDDGRLVVTIKWSDFGLSKQTDETGYFTMTNNSGNNQWLAPEILKYLNNEQRSPDEGRSRFSIKCDIFATGCLFFWFVTGGKHPFGVGQVTIPPNIIEGNACNLHKLGDQHYAFNLIRQMIVAEREERVITMEQVVAFLANVAQ